MRKAAQLRVCRSEQGAWHVGCTALCGELTPRLHADSYVKHTLHQSSCFHTPCTGAAQVARQEGVTLADLQAALQMFDRQYAATAAGPDKWRRHAEFMRDVYGAAVRDVAERSSQRARDEARDAAARAAQAEASLRQVQIRTLPLSFHHTLPAYSLYTPASVFHARCTCSSNSEV